MQTSRKIKIELQDSKGEKYNICLQGKFSREKVAKILEIMESVENITTQSQGDATTENKQITHTISLGDTLWSIIIDNLSDKEFNSSDVSHIYEKIYDQAIYLSIVSTYLGRFFARGKLHRVKHGKEWIYSLVHTQYTTNIVTNHSSTSHFANVMSPSTVYDLRQ